MQDKTDGPNDEQGERCSCGAFLRHDGLSCPYCGAAEPVRIQATLEQLSKLIHEQLSHADQLFVARAILEQPERAAALLSLYGGVAFTARDFAALTLRIARELAQPGGAS